MPEDTSARKFFLTHRAVRDFAKNRADCSLPATPTRAQGSPIAKLNPMQRLEFLDDYSKDPLHAAGEGSIRGSSAQSAKREFGQG